MIKTALKFILLIIPFTMLFGTSSETFILTEVMNPQKMCVFGENLIVVDGFEFHLFSLKDMKDMAHFGREGDGPGELQADPFWYNSVFFSGEEIFVEMSRKGFVIDVINSKGDKIREINRDVKRILIDKKDKDTAIEHIKNDPTVKNLLGFERLKEMTKFIYPDAYPAITGLIADKNQLYVLTSEIKDGGTECLVLDSQGNELDRIYVPIVNPAPFVSQLLGVQFFTISDRKLYYAEVEGDDTILHIQDFVTHKK